MVLELKLRALHKLRRVLCRRASASFLLLIFYCHFFVHMDVYVCVCTFLYVSMYVGVCMWRPGNNFGHLFIFCF